MNTHRNYDPRTIQKNKRMVSDLKPICHNCSSEDVRIVGRLDDEISCQCTRCNTFFEIMELAE